MPIKKLKEAQKTLNDYFLEREDVIEGLILSLIAKQNVFLLGQASTGKTALSESFIRIVEGEEPFSILVGGFTTPEELFGGLIMDEYVKGNVARNYKNRLPDVRLAFIDELFKANPVFLNTLLGLMHETERRFFDSGKMIKTPLNMIIGASNELPDEDDGLYPLYDRFGFRFHVKEIKNPDNRKKARLNKVMGIGSPDVPKITPQELEQVQLFARFVDITKINDVLEEININLRDEGVFPTPRRLEATLKLLQAKAIFEGRNEPIEEDLIIAKNTLWDDPEEIEIVEKVVKKFSQDRVLIELERIEEEAQEIFQYGITRGRKEEIFEATTKLKHLSGELQHLIKKFPERTKEINELLERVDKAKEQLIEKTLEPIVEEIELKF